MTLGDYRPAVGPCWTPAGQVRTGRTAGGPDRNRHRAATAYPDCCPSPASRATTRVNGCRVNRRLVETLDRDAVRVWLDR